MFLLNALRKQITKYADDTPRIQSCKCKKKFYINLHMDLIDGMDINTSSLAELENSANYRLHKCFGSLVIDMIPSTTYKLRYRRFTCHETPLVAKLKSFYSCYRNSPSIVWCEVSIGTHQHTTNNRVSVSELTIVKILSYDELMELNGYDICTVKCGTHNAVEYRINGILHSDYSNYEIGASSIITYPDCIYTRILAKYNIKYLNADDSPAGIYQWYRNGRLAHTLYSREYYENIPGKIHDEAMIARMRDNPTVKYNTCVVQYPSTSTNETSRISVYANKKYRKFFLDSEEVHADHID
jgi:hypothetical protein